MLLGTPSTANPETGLPPKSILVFLVHPPITSTTETLNSKHHTPPGGAGHSRGACKVLARGLRDLDRGKKSPGQLLQRPSCPTERLHASKVNVLNRHTLADLVWPEIHFQAILPCGL